MCTFVYFYYIVKMITKICCPELYKAVLKIQFFITENAEVFHREPQSIEKSMLCEHYPDFSGFSAVNVCILGTSHK